MDRYFPVFIADKQPMPISLHYSNHRLKK